MSHQGRLAIVDIDGALDQAELGRRAWARQRSSRATRSTGTCPNAPDSVALPARNRPGRCPSPRPLTQSVSSSGVHRRPAGRDRRLVRLEHDTSTAESSTRPFTSPTQQVGRIATVAARPCCIGGKPAATARSQAILCVASRRRSCRACLTVLIGRTATMSNEFVGAGLGVPAASWTRRARSSWSTDDREIQEAIRLIIGTAYGERPMRPDFGCAIHDFVFAEADASTAGRIAYEVRASLHRWEPRIDIDDVVVTVDAQDRSLMYIDVRYRHQEHERPPQPGLSLLHHPGRAARQERAAMSLPGTEPRRPSLPGPGRRREAPRPAAHARLDGSQRVRSRASR